MICYRKKPHRVATKVDNVYSHSKPVRLNVTRGGAVETKRGGKELKLTNINNFNRLMRMRVVPEP